MNTTTAEIEPRLVMTFKPDGYPYRGLAFQLPKIPGIPDPETSLAGGLRTSSNAVAFSGLLPDEAEATLSALAETYTRSRYHKLRFEDCLALANARRNVLGGPVVADFHAVMPVIWEAAAFLGTVRTAVDQLTYIAARRAGKSEASADGWAAHEAINPKCPPGGTPPTKYDVPEILAIRAKQPWFDDLNVYRNVAYHRGAGGERYGIYSSADTAEEASDPEFNAMLLPDIDPLRQRARPHSWTYKDKRRLDTLIADIDKTFTDLLVEIFTQVWGCQVPKEGTMPRSEHPEMFLYLPMPVSLQAPDRCILPVFDSKVAARKFTLYPSNHGLVIRAVRPTKIGADPPFFLLPTVLRENLPHEVHVYGMVGGELTLRGTVPVDPKECPLEGIIPIHVLDGSLRALYVYQSPKA